MDKRKLKTAIADKYYNNYNDYKDYNNYLKTKLGLPKQLIFRVRHLARSFFVQIAAIILVAFLAIELIIHHPVLAVSWSKVHADYSQRKQLTLVNNSGQTLHANSTYQVSIDTKSLYDQGKLKTNCDDLRIVYQPNNTTATELKRAVAPNGGTTCALSSATIVSFPLQADIYNNYNDYNYYIYYGNRQATAYPTADALDAYNIGAKEATFVAPFNGTTTALAAGSGTPSVESGAVRFSGGKSALAFDGENDYVSLGNSVDLDLGTNTTEAWIKIDKANSASGMVNTIASRGSPGSAGFWWFYESGGTIHYQFAVGVRVDGPAISYGVWHHVAVVHTDSRTVDFFIDGVKSSYSATTPYTANDGTAAANLGTNAASGGNEFGGFMDEVRISNTVRYSSNFTPQTSPFVRDEYTKLLLHFDENGDDPRNTGKAIDDSGNGNHGTITGAKYVGGLVGVDGSNSTNLTNSSNLSNGSYASHNGIFIEEGTTNKITNPSFENASSYTTNWSSPAVFDYDSTADTFTAGAAKRNSAGPFASGVILQDKYGATGGDLVQIGAGTSIAGNFKQTVDKDQGSIVFWLTPERVTGSRQRVVDFAAGYIEIINGKLRVDFTSLGYAHSTTLVAGNTYFVAVRWDTKNALNGTNRGSFTVDGMTEYFGPFLTSLLHGTDMSLGINYAIESTQAIIEGLTLYRRPLYTVGTPNTGIDVGNGDEINQIYNSGTGKDPTLVTGSWDVVFALPTNATTGALATGTGNAWSHPHSSNLLYTSTTNTGGFMMNGTPATDGWSEIPWYKVGGASGVVAAYQPIGATDLANSYINKANPGIYDTAPGVAPTWDTTNGWIFANGQYLLSGIVLSTDYSIAVRYSNAELVTGTNTEVMGGRVGGSNGLAVLAKNNSTIPGCLLIDTHGARSCSIAGQTSGSLAVTNGAIYRDGSLLSNPTAGTITDSPTVYLGGASGYGVSHSKNIQAAAVYSSPITATQGISITSAMQNLTSAGTYGTLAALATNEKIFSGGYKFTSTGANQGITRSFTATNGGDYVVRALGHADASCQPQVKVTRADGTTEITHLNGASNTTRTTPSTYIFTFESPAAEALNVQLINLNSSGTCYWHQVEVLSNMIDNPSMERGSGVTDNWLPSGYTGELDTGSKRNQETTTIHSGLSSVKFENGTGSWSRVLQNVGSQATGKFESVGGFGYNSLGMVRIGYSPNTDIVGQDNVTYYLPSTGTDWKHYRVVARIGSSGSSRWLRFGDSSLGYADDLYNILLSDVSLTVTPATEANSLETSGLRVDGTDTLTQPLDTLTTTSGNIQFKFTPRHKSTDSALLYGNQYEYWFYARNTLGGGLNDIYCRKDGVAFGCGVWANNVHYALTSVSSISYNAGDTLALEFSYQDGTARMSLNGVVKFEKTGISAFSTVPNMMYFGTDQNSMYQADATFAAPGFTGTVTATVESNSISSPYIKFGSKSLKLVASSDARYVTSINPGNTNTHTLSAYVYDGTTGNIGGTVSTTVAKFIFNGSSVVPSAYTDQGGGWWRLSYSGAASNAASDYGIAVLSGKTIYVDGVQLEEKAYATTYTDGTLGSGYAWTGTVNDSTSTRTNTDLLYTSTSNIGASSGTINLWLKPDWSTSDVTGSSTRKTIVSTGSPITSTSHDLYLFYDEAGRFVFYVDASSNPAANYITVARGQWVHIVATWNGSSTILYANNTASTAANYTQALNPGTLYVGRRSAGQTNNGSISDFRILSSPLSSTEVADLYYSGLVSHKEDIPVERFSTDKGQNPIGIYHFDEGYGTVTNDSSPYRNHATLSASTATPTWITESQCVVGKCLKYDGTNDTTTVANKLLNVQSIGLWINPMSNTSSIIDLDGGTHYISSTNGVLSATGFDNPTIYVNGAPSTSLRAGSWNYIEVTTATPFNATALTFGKAGATFFNGFMDELRIYPYARTADQVLVDYNKTSSVILSNSEGSLSNGLVGYWKMDEASGTLTDSSGNGNTGTWSGTGASHYSTGKYGNGGGFNGSDDYVTYNTITPGTSFSVGAWVYPTENGTTSHRTIIGFVSGSNDNNISIEMRQGNYRFAIGNVNDAGRKVEYPVTVNTWTYLLGTYDGSKLRFYINGSLIGTTSVTGTLPDAPQINGKFGSTNGTMYFYQGKLDETRIYNRALSPAEVKDLYNYAPGPVAHWSFDEGSGLSAADKSGNGNTGTLATAPATPTWTSGKYGKGLSFDGGDYVSRADTDSLSITKSFTISSWVKPTSLTDTGPIVAKDTSGGKRSFYLNININKFRALISSDGGSTLIYRDSATAFSVNTWYYVSAVYDSAGQTLNMYVNGVLDNGIISAAVPTSIYDGNADINIGFDSSLSKYLSGQLDDVRIYNYARTAKQIISDMQSEHPSVASAQGGAQPAIAYYRFDEGQGTVANNAGSGGSTLNGTLTNMSAPATATSGWTKSGKFGTALQFDGINDYVDSGNQTVLKPTAAFSVSGWINSSSFSTYQRYLVSQGMTCVSPSRMWEVITEVGGKLVLMWSSDGQNTKSPMSIKSLSSGVWQQFTVTFNNGTVKFYINGVLDSTDTTSQGSNAYLNTNAVRTGYGFCNANDVNIRPFSGSLDEVKIYNYALTADEVKTEYNRGSAIVMGSLSTESNGTNLTNSSNRSYCVPGDTAACNPPIAEWNFDAGSGQSVVDTSGNNNTGQLGATTGIDITDPTWTNGKQGKGLSFDGADDYVPVANSSSLNFGSTTSFTLESWVYRKTSTNHAIIAKKLDGAASNAGYTLYVSTDWGGRVLSMISDGTNQVYSDCNTSNNGVVATKNRWNHIVTVIDRTSKTLTSYMNGAKCSVVGDITSVGSIDNTRALGIGNNGTGGSLINGLLDQVRIYNYARTPAQIAYDYNRGAPVAWYKMDECSGATLHSSNNPYNSTLNATLNIGATLPQSQAGTCSDGFTTSAWYNGRDGKFSSSVNFDGVDDYVSTTPTALLGNSAGITVSAWFKPSGFSTRNIVAQGSLDSLANFVFQARLQSTTQILWNISSGTGQRQFIATVPAMSAGNWYHFTGIWNGTSQTVYLDGKLADSTSSSVPASINSASKAIYIGNEGRLQGTGYFPGQIDDVRIYNYALTPLQVKDVFNGGAIRFSN